MLTFTVDTPQHRGMASLALKSWGVAYSTSKEIITVMLPILCRQWGTPTRQFATTTLIRLLQDCVALRVKLRTSFNLISMFNHGNIEDLSSMRMKAFATCERSVVPLPRETSRATMHNKIRHNVATSNSISEWSSHSCGIERFHTLAHTLFLGWGSFVPNAVNFWQI